MGNNKRTNLCIHIFRRVPKLDTKLLLYENGLKGVSTKCLNLVAILTCLIELKSNPLANDK